MAITAPPAVDVLPPAPLLSDKASFLAKVDPHNLALPVFRQQLVNLAGNVFANAIEVVTIAGNAAQSAQTAQTQATIATNAANAALNNAGAALWVSGTNYALGACAVSRVNFYTYRCKVAGVSATDPKDDPAKWVLISNVGNPLVMQIQEIQAQGVGGGDANAPSNYYVRGVNTTLFNEIVGASLSAGVITLPAGVYDIECGAAQYNASIGFLSLYNTADNVQMLRGCSAGVSGHCYVTLSGRFSLSAAKTIVLRHFIVTQGTNYVNVRGYPIGQGAEMYGWINLWKVA